MTKAQVIATAIVLFVVAVVLVAHKQYVEHRTHQLLTVEFAAGTSEKEVVAVLGTPEQDLSGPELLRKFPRVELPVSQEQSAS